MDSRFFGNFKSIKVSELAVICDLKIIGDRDFEILSVETLRNAKNFDLAFFDNKKYLEDLKETKAGAIIISERNAGLLPDGAVGLVAKNVLVSYAKALEVLTFPEEHLSHISETAKISESAKIGLGSYIGDFVVIEDDVEIGKNSVVEAHTVIKKGTKIGACALIRANVTISHSVIGNDVKIHSGAQIGSSGFGIVPSDSRMVYIKQIGRVIIGDRVRIGANTTIDRGAIEDTIIGSDTIIDNLVQIAHNVVIGERSIIVSQVGIAGSSRIGNDVVLAGQVGVSGHISIGDRAIVAAKSGIAANIEAGKVVGGIPAVDIGLWRRQVAFLKIIVSKKAQIAKMLNPSNYRQRFMNALSRIFKSF